MRQSKNKNGFTRVDHITFDLILPMLSTAAQVIFLRIYRQTRGWGKLTDKIALSQFKTKCNIKSHKTISKAIDELLALDLITEEGKGTEIKEYGINRMALDIYWQRHVMALEEEKLSTK